MNWYSYKWRNADPAIGRFMGIDPITEDYMTISPYQFAHNNPVWKIELEGLEGMTVNGVDLLNNEPGPNPSNHLPLPIDNQTTNSSGSKTYSLGDYDFSEKYLTSYPGQSVDDLVTKGIQWLGEQITGSDVSEKTSNNIQLGVNIFITITSKGKNTKAETEIVEQLTKAEGRAAKLSKTSREGKDFTKAGKEAVIDVNKTKNGGSVICKGCGTNTIPATKSTKGVTPSKLERQVDHVIPKSKGGSGTPNNGEVLCRGCNIKKSNN